MPGKPGGERRKSWRGDFGEVPYGAVQANTTRPA
jgi:hypothetical protein